VQPPYDADTNIERFRRLCLLNDAVLYDDEYLQVGVKAEYSGCDGRLMMYFGNKSSTTLQSFTVQYFQGNNSRSSPLRIAPSPISQQLEAGVQVAQHVGITLIEPFLESPWMRVQFLLPDASPRRIQLRLPVIVTKFMRGRDLNPSEFFKMWRQQNFALNEVSTVVQIAANLRGSQTDAAKLQMAANLVFGSALRLQRDIDENPDNFVLVGELIEPSQSSQNDSCNHFRSISQGYGDASNLTGCVLSLVRVEIGSGRFLGKARVVVRSDSSHLAQALGEAIAMQLGEASMPRSGMAMRGKI